MLDEPPGADPHAGWCGDWGLKTPGYPIRLLCDPSMQRTLESLLESDPRKSLVRSPKELTDAQVGTDSAQRNAPQILVFSSQQCNPRDPGLHIHVALILCQPVSAHGALERCHLAEDLLYQ
jgi:hypothetical protein